MGVGKVIYLYINRGPTNMGKILLKMSVVHLSLIYLHNTLLIWSFDALAHNGNIDIVIILTNQHETRHTRIIGR